MRTRFAGLMSLMLVAGCDGAVSELPVCGSANLDAGVQPEPDSGVVVIDAGQADAGVRDAGVMPPPILGACNQLSDAGVFERISPPGVMDGFAIAVDPVNQGTLYVGTIHQKFWKSTDCGATWTGIPGRGAALVNAGMNWTVAVDPIEPNVVYTNSGYGGLTNGLFKSTNSGADWDVIWPPPSQPALALAFDYNFANVIAIDPIDHLHLLLTFHEQCKAPHPSTCIAESMNGGQTWQLIDGDPVWDGREGQVIFFLDDSSTWLWGSQTNGFWRSGDRGVSWQQIPGMTTSHLQGSQLLRVASGRYFMAGSDGVWTSPNGTASSWQLVPNTGPIVGGLVSDGVNMYTSTCYFPSFCTAARYLKSPVTDGQTWTEMPSPALPMGGTLAFDLGHGLLYSSSGAGVWRVKVR